MVDLFRTRPPGAWPEGWAGWENTQEAFRRLTDEFVAGLRPNREALAGRGVVIAGGGAKYLPGVWLCVNKLRRLGCTLPVQVWHLGEGEMDPPMRRLLQDL